MVLTNGAVARANAAGPLREANTNNTVRNMLLEAIELDPDNSGARKNLDLL